MGQLVLLADTELEYKYTARIVLIQHKAAKGDIVGLHAVSGCCLQVAFLLYITDYNVMCVYLFTMILLFTYGSRVYLS